MRVPPIVPVLTEQSAASVQAVVAHGVAEMARTRDWRTRVWLAAKALEWLHANAAGFVGAGSRGEGRQRRAFQRVWRAVDVYLTPEQARVVRAFEGALAARGVPANTLSEPRRVGRPDAMCPRLLAAMACFHEHRADTVWRTLLLAHAFDVLLANPDHFPVFGTRLATVMVNKWREVGAEWPQFMEAYPVRLLPSTGTQ